MRATGAADTSTLSVVCTASGWEQPRVWYPAKLQHSSSVKARERCTKLFPSPSPSTLPGPALLGRAWHCWYSSAEPVATALAQGQTLLSTAREHHLQLL